jgi:hypothetical protein
MGRTWLRYALLASSCVLGTALPALAIGPVDGEIGAVWWANDFEVTEGDAGASASGDAPGYRVELWLFQRFGFEAAAYSSDLDSIGADSSDYRHIDLLWRPFSPTDNNFLALGAGWQQMDLGTIGLDGDTSGPRAVVEGRIGLLGPVYFYGLASYLPTLDDTRSTDPALGEFRDMHGYELDAGVACTILPFISLRAGYRSQSIDYTRSGFVPLPGEPSQMDGQVDSSGYIAGLSFRF